MNTYEAYLNDSKGNTLAIENAQEIYRSLVESMDKCTAEDKNVFVNDFLKKAFEYTSIRCKWELMTREEKLEADPGRTMAHDSFITATNILARIAGKEGIDVSWRAKLGDERKSIGDFACFVTYITGISNR